MGKTHNRQVYSVGSHVLRIMTAIITLSLPGVCYAQTSICAAPSGYFTLTVSAGNVTTPVPTALSMPFHGDASLSGRAFGLITGVTSNTLACQDAEWKAGELSSPTTPYVLIILSGAAKGHSFLLSTSKPNTATTVALNSSENVDLATLGIVAGKDTYGIVPCNTIASIFGTPATSGVLGAATPDKADQIMLLSDTGTWNRYYFNTVKNSWYAVGSNVPANNVPILFSAGIIYNRLASTPLIIRQPGRTPCVQRSVSIAKSGLTFLGNGWPTDTTLASSALNQTTGWNSATDFTKADQVQIMRSGVWIKYYHDGTQWRQVGNNAPSNNVILEAGSATLISKLGNATGNVTLTQALPYSLK